MLRVTLALTLLTALPVTAASQPQTKDQQTTPQSRQASNLSPDALYAGWRARQLIGQDVSWGDKRQLGKVRDVIVDRNGQAAAIMVETGDVSGIPDTVFRAPWRKVTLKRGDAGEMNVQLSSDWSRPDQGDQARSDVRTWPHEYRVSEVIGDNARLRTGYLFGYVTDVVFSRDGRVMAALVAPDTSETQGQQTGGGSVLAFSFQGRTTGQWDPGSSYFGLPAVSPEGARQAGLEIEPQRFASAGASMGRASGESGRADEGSRPMRDDTAQMPDRQSSVPKDERQALAANQRTGDRTGERTGRTDRTAANQDREFISSDARTVRLPSAESVYQGWRAKSLIDQTVYGRNNNALGEVHDVILSADGQIAAIVVEGGGFLDIGDAHFRIPWSQVDRTPTPGRSGITVDISEQEATRQGLFDSGEAISMGEREFRLSELLNDYVVLENGVGYGYVNDAVFTDKGQLLAVLVNRDVRYGPRYTAYPYYGYRYGWHPAHNYYAIPFGTVEEASQGPSIDTKRMADSGSGQRDRPMKSTQQDRQTDSK